eukprot:scaffold648011_cov42-Prasinocladus_malaysianus.AAC.1
MRDLFSDSSSIAPAEPANNDVAPDTDKNEPVAYVRCAGVSNQTCLGGRYCTEFGRTLNSLSIR